MVSRRHRRHELMERDHNTIPSDKLRPSIISDVLPTTSFGLSSFVRSLDDRREFHPLDFFRPAASVFTEDRNVNVRSVARRNGVSVGSSVNLFSVPERVAVCVRRKERREVLFAKGKARGYRRKRFNYWSAVKC